MSDVEARGVVDGGDPMKYVLGIDLGTTYTAAAIFDADGPRAMTLGNRYHEIPSVAFVEDDGTVLVGESAERKGLARPSRLVREFKRRVGDSVPILIDGAPVVAHMLMSSMIRHVVTAVSALQGQLPDAVIVTYPANWGPYKYELLAQAAEIAQVSKVELLNEPEAIAGAYSWGDRLRPGEIVAVYDLGGGTFDSAVLRKTDRGFELLGPPKGIEQLGGIDFDDVVFRFVLDAIGLGHQTPDTIDDVEASLYSQLRENCVRAKEALSFDTEATVLVSVAGAAIHVRINRTEFESLIRPAIQATIAALSAALSAANVTPADVGVVFMAGGSARIPLVTEMLAASFHRPLELDPDPENSVARGAAIAAAKRHFPPNVAPTSTSQERPPGQESPAAAPPDSSRAWRRAPRRRFLVAALIVSVLLVASGAVWWVGGLGANRNAQAQAPGPEQEVSVAPASWQSLPPLPVAVEGAAAAAYDGRVWVAGGISNDAERTKLSSVYVYDPGSGRWSSGPSLPRATSHASLVATSWGLYFVGGYVQEGASDDVALLDSSMTKWVPQAISLPGPRVAGAAAFDGARIIFAGGTRPDGTAADEIWSFDQGDWVDVGRLPAGSEKLSAVTDGDGTVWVMAGRDSSASRRIPNVTTVYDGRLSATASGESIVDPPVDSAAGVRIEGSGRCLIGGETDEGLNDWWCDQVGAADRLPALDPPRAGLAAATIGNTVYVVGGYGAGFEGTSKFESLTIEN